MSHIGDTLALAGLWRKHIARMRTENNIHGRTQDFYACNYCSDIVNDEFRRYIRRTKRA